MKTSLFFTLIALSFQSLAQLQAPKASPLAKVEQRIGLTDVKLEYSRPAKNGREIFGSLLPYGEIWRAGANENTKFTTSDPIVFDQDTLKSGTYALFIIPTKQTWEVIFYTDFSNWGTPEKWDETKVALRKKVNVMNLKDVTESFTIGIDAVEIKRAVLSFEWDKTRAEIAFSVPTDTKMIAAIQKTMEGPTASEYYAAGEYYYKEKKDLQQALIWVNKALEQRGSAYWMLRTKALIQAELGDYNGAITTIKLSLVEAEKANNTTYIDLNKASLEAWEKKK
jgi:hypothetical protein